MSARVAAWLAWSLCPLCVALAAACLIFSLLNGHTLYEMVLTGIPTTVILLTQMVSFSVVGALIASHRPENPIGWLFCAAALFYGIEIAGEGVRDLCAPHEPRLSSPGSGVGLADGVDLGAGVRHNPSVPAPSLPGWPPAVTPLAGGRLARWPLHRPDLRPDLHRSLARTRPGAAAARRLRGRGRRMALCDIGVGAETGEPDAAGGRARCRDLAVRPLPPGEGDERQQIKWFASAAALTLAWIIVAEEQPGEIVALSGLLVIASIPVATGIAILRYRLYDIDRIINRTLVYGSLTVMLALLYFGGVVLLQALFGALTGQEEQPQLAIVVSTLVIAALFNPCVGASRFHRPQLLPQEVRRSKDPRGLLCQAARRDRPGRLERRL